MAICEPAINVHNPVEVLICTTSDWSLVFIIEANTKASSVVVAPFLIKLNSLLTKTDRMREISKFAPML